MPSTLALKLRKLLIVSRRLQNSLVHVPLNAPGKKASTTWPFASSWLSVTLSRSWLTSVNSGALLPTSAAICFVSSMICRPEGRHYDINRRPEGRHDSMIRRPEGRHDDCC